MVEDPAQAVDLQQRHHAIGDLAEFIVEVEYIGLLAVIVQHGVAMGSVHGDGLDADQDKMIKM